VQPKLAQLLNYQSHNLVETKYLQHPLQSPSGVISITHQVLNIVQGWPLWSIFVLCVHTLLLLIYLQRCDEECTTACRPQNLTSNRSSSGSTEIQPIRKPSWACQACQQLSLRTLLRKTNWHICCQHTQAVAIESMGWAMHLHESQGKVHTKCGVSMVFSYLS
jgi:hypothetical protein